MYGLQNVCSKSNPTLTHSRKDLTKCLSHQQFFWRDYVQVGMRAVQITEKENGELDELYQQMAGN